MGRQTHLRHWRAVVLMGLAAGIAACHAPATPIAPVQPASLRAASPAEQAIEGRILTVTMDQTSLGVGKQFRVYVPPGYAKGGRYPVLYLFRGTMDEWLNPHQDPHRRGRTAVTVYENLRRQSKVGDMILVFPGLGSDDGRWPGILTDWQHPELAPGVGNGRFAEYFRRDVMGTVDQEFRTLADGRHRAVDGFSLGGWAAVQAATSMPDQFASVGAYDGTFPMADGPGRIQADDGLQEVDFFKPVFGLPWNQQAAVAASPANRILQGAANRWQAVTWMIEYCPEAIEPRGNFYRGDALVKALAAKGARNRLPGEMPGGEHTWWHADEHLTKTLPLHWQSIRAR